jgi:dipeptidyl aminopeptidase/acylaminoacyl peptidase
MSANGPWIDHFPGNGLWSNAILVTKGMAPYGAVALGEIDQVCEKLRARQSEPQAWWEEWTAMAKRLHARADALDAAGHRMSAGNYYLRAGMYYFTAERFIYPGADKREMGRIAIDCQTRGILRRYPNVERVEVPYEGKSLPALFMKAPHAQGRTPTIVLFNGMDNCKEMSVLFAGLEFTARGWHTLAIDGPGQGESLRLRELYARHDFEVAGTAAYDYVATRAEVDAARTFVMGYSFGGYYAARCAAYEKRYRGGIAMSALHWDLHGWQRDIKRRQDADPKGTPQSAFHFRWIMGCIDVANGAEAALEKARQFTLVEAAGKITCPFIIVHAAQDTVVPVANAPRLFDAIAATDKQLKILTAEDGGHYHAQADNRQVGIDCIADWIEKRL